jgi:hypothetical protein
MTGSPIVSRNDIAHIPIVNSDGHSLSYLNDITWQQLADQGILQFLEVDKKKEVIDLPLIALWLASRIPSYYATLRRNDLSTARK